MDIRQQLRHSILNGILPLETIKTNNETTGMITACKLREYSLYDTTFSVLSQFIHRHFTSRCRGASRWKYSRYFSNAEYAEFETVIDNHNIKETEAR